MESIINGVQRYLIENNYIHDFYAQNSRGRISLKSDFSWKNSDIIIRFNKLETTRLIQPTTTGYTTYGSGVRFNNCLDNVAVYGNLIKDVGHSGIFTTWGWDQTYASDGCIPENVYVFSNVVDTTYAGSGLYVAGTSGSDHFKNTYFSNNLFYHIAHEDAEEYPTKNYGMQLIGADNNFQDVYLKNNVIDTPRLPALTPISIRSPYLQDVSFDYNHHYSIEGPVSVYFENTACTPCLWNSDKVPGDYGIHDSTGAPLFIDPDTQNFGIQDGSPLIDSGEAIDAEIRPMTIHDTTYELDIGEGLDPTRTDWTQTIPIVYTLNQDDYGSSWEKGPYIFTEGGCTSSWTCGNWNCDACISGEQTCARVCIDTNGCSSERTETEQRPCSDRKRYTAKKALSGVEIDGDISEFTEAEKIEISAGEAQGHFSLMWDEDYLYIAGEISDSHLNTEYTEHDSNLWEDDSMELMIDTGNDLGSRMNNNDFKIYISASGVTTDTNIFDATWESGIEHILIADGSVNDNSDSDIGYVFEALIPIDNLASTTSSWGMDIALNDKTATGKTQDVWNNPTSNYNVPDNWGEIVFEDTCAGIGDVVIGLDDWKNGHVSFTGILKLIQTWKDNPC